jgi:large subunit ribosomal protein L21e
MGRSKGKRSNTRNSFSRAFKKHGQEHSSTYIQNFKLGEYVDISVNSSIQRGLPYKFYHGKTGKIFNITKSSAGVEVEKKIGNKRIIKRLNIRLEHLIKSKSRINFFEKLKNRDSVRQFYNFRSNKAICFREVGDSKRQGHFIIFKKLINIDPEPYSIVV